MIVAVFFFFFFFFNLKLYFYQEKISLTKKGVGLGKESSNKNIDWF